MIQTECEECCKPVILTSSYKGQPIVCIPCGKKLEQSKGAKDD